MESFSKAKGFPKGKYKSRLSLLCSSSWCESRPSCKRLFCRGMAAEFQLLSKEMGAGHTCLLKRSLWCQPGLLGKRFSLRQFSQLWWEATHIAHLSSTDFREEKQSLGSHLGNLGALKIRQIFLEKSLPSISRILVVINYQGYEVFGLHFKVSFILYEFIFHEIDELDEKTK